MDLAISRTVFTVLSEVKRVLTTSMSFITGAGLNQCIPISLDTVKEIGDYLYSETGDEKKLPPPMLKEMVYAGYKGSKKVKMNSNGGWYDL